MVWGRGCGGGVWGRGPGGGYVEEGMERTENEEKGTSGSM